MSAFSAKSSSPAPITGISSPSFSLPPASTPPPPSSSPSKCSSANPSSSAPDLLPFLAGAQHRSASPFCLYLCTPVLCTLRLCRGGLQSALPLAPCRRSCALLSSTSYHSPGSRQSANLGTPPDASIGKPQKSAHWFVRL